MVGAFMKNKQSEPWERPALRRISPLQMACIGLLLLAVSLAAVCIYYVRVNGRLAEENITLSQALYDAEQKVRKKESEIRELEAKIAELTTPKTESIYSYEEWKRQYNAGVVDVGYEEYTRALDDRKKPFSLDEYIKSKEEWRALSNAGLTDLSFEEWQNAIEEAENKSRPYGSFNDDYVSGKMK